VIEHVHLQYSCRAARIHLYVSNLDSSKYLLLNVCSLADVRVRTLTWSFGGRCATASREAGSLSQDEPERVAVSAPARAGCRDHHVAGVGTSTAVQNNGAVIVPHSWKNWLGFFAAATALAGGLASIFHRDNATLLPQFSDHCSDACPCGTI
jgi:hypothetical protein